MMGKDKKYTHEIVNPTSKDTKYNLRLQKDLKEDFIRVCNANGYKPSEVLRAMMVDYVNKGGS